MSLPKILVVGILNGRRVSDDNFDVKLNGHLIGRYHTVSDFNDPTPNNQIQLTSGSLFIGSPSHSLASGILWDNPPSLIDPNPATSLPWTQAERNHWYVTGYSGQATTGESISGHSFSPFYVANGNNEIYLQNTATGYFSNGFQLFAWEYEQSGSLLVNPTNVFAQHIGVSIGTDFSGSFYAETSPLKEFYPSYTIDYNDLSQQAVGEAVHKERDVALSFEFLDNTSGEALTDFGLNENQFISQISYDILDITGGSVYPNFQSGSPAAQFTLSESENIKMFGSYTKDFRVRAVLENNIEGSSPFESIFNIYGNLPIITGASIYKFGITGSGGIPTGYITGSSFPIELFLQNDLEFVKVTSFDIYGSHDSTGIVVDSNPSTRQFNSTYLHSYEPREQTLSSVCNFDVLKKGLSYDSGIYFKIVPFCPFGAGTTIDFGPLIFIEEPIPLSIPTLGAQTYITGTVPSGEWATIDELPLTGFAVAKYVLAVTNETGAISYADIIISPPVSGVSSLSLVVNHSNSSSYMSYSGYTGIDRITVSASGVTGGQGTFSAIRCVF